MTLDCFNRRRTKRRSQGSFLFLWDPAFTRFPQIRAARFGSLVQKQDLFFIFPGPALRRPAKGAAAEREGLLFPPPAVSAFAPPYLSFRLAEKKDSAAPGGRKKRALNALDLWSRTGLGIAIVEHCACPGAIVR